VTTRAKAKRTPRLPNGRRVIDFPVTPITSRPHPDVAFAVTVLRQARQFSQEHLGQLIDMPRTFITKVERGKVEPTIPSVRKLAKGLGVSTRTLIAISEVRRAA
jgi:ribosome-binding protein aMBF1 (putative translation factor)